MSNKRWMRPEERAVEAPFLAVFRNRFHAGSGAVLKFRYSADERAAFFLDGEKIADGPERGTPQRWFFHSVEVPLAPGAHVLTCRLLVLGGNTPLTPSSPYVPAFAWTRNPICSAIGSAKP